MTDPRWSDDGSYFSFTLKEESASSVVLVDALNWKEIGRLSDAENGFVVSDNPRERASARTL
jgi:hypothetical protein